MPKIPGLSGPVFSYRLRSIVGFWLVEMAISTNQKPTIYRILYEITAPALQSQKAITDNIRKKELLQFGSVRQLSARALIT